MPGLIEDGGIPDIEHVDYQVVPGILLQQIYRLLSGIDPGQGRRIADVQVDILPVKLGLDLSVLL